MSFDQDAKEKAIAVLAHCAGSTGFSASGLPGGYRGLWARDSMISSLGAALAREKFRKVISQSIETLSTHQSELGQIPNAVGDYNRDRRSRVTFNTIDSNLWYLIGHHVYAKTYNDKTLVEKHKTHIAKALVWLQYQSPNEDKLLAQQPTMDWQDAFPHKYGRTINTHALYYAVLGMYGKHQAAQHIKRVINGDIEKYLSLYDSKLGYYLPWAWKPHDGYREQGEWFDTLGNLLAIVTGLATPTIANRILHHIEKEKINKPYPCKAIYPPIKPDDKEWHSYFVTCEARTPYHYLNAGIWPFIGGFYVAALVKAKQHRKAQNELEVLTQANQKGKTQKWEFNEWLHGKTGEPKGAPYQAWSAAMYLFAKESVEQKRVPFFDEWV